MHGGTARRTGRILLAVVAQQPARADTTQFRGVNWADQRGNFVDGVLRMWDTVIARYAGNRNAYFEVINEPHGYSTTDLNNTYSAWPSSHSGVPRGRVILDGAGLAQNVAAVGQDSRLNDTLLAVHDYSFFADYLRGVSGKLRELGVGGAYWPGLRVRNVGTGLYFDGMGRTANGANAGQYTDSTSPDQRWKIVAAR